MPGSNWEVVCLLHWCSFKIIKFACLQQLKSPNSRNKFQMLRFLLYFCVFVDFVGILWIYLNFVALRPRKTSEALTDTYVKAILIHKCKVDLSSRIHKAQRLLRYMYNIYSMVNAFQLALCLVFTNKMYCKSILFCHNEHIYLFKNWSFITFSLSLKANCFIFTSPTK